MAAQRKPRQYVHRPKPLGTGDEFVDRVTLGTTKYVVEGYTITEDDEQPDDNPEISVVVSGRAPQRQPYDFYHPPNPKNVIELNPGIKLIPKGKKWCSCCVSWVKLDGFSEDKRNRDQLQSHCKSCRAEHARKMYWAAKHTAIAIAA